MDDDLYEVLHDYVNFENTIVQFYSDHGLQFGFWWAFQNKVFVQENRMPTNMMIFPSKLLDENPQWRANLTANQQALITHFDMRSTWLDLVQSSVGITEYKLSENQIKLSQTLAYQDDYDKNGPVRKAFNQGKSVLRPVPRNRTIEEIGIPNSISICEKNK